MGRTAIHAPAEKNRVVRRTVRLARRPLAGRRVYQSSAPPPLEDWGTIARLYDVEHPACRGAELTFWHQEATAGGGDVLELAAGTGRIAIAIARKGHHVTGLERSPGMLERAQARTARRRALVADRLEWVAGDMATFELPGRHFGLIFVAYNSFWLLDGEAAQASCLRAAARHLLPGGRLVLDVFPPTGDDRQDETGIAQRLPLPVRGQTVLRIKDYSYDPARDAGASDVRYYAADPDTGEPAGLLAQFRYSLFLAQPEQVQALLEREGYVVEATYGTYGRDALTPDSPRAIFVARRP
ncbi:MAG: class I SAM-dependent methyltransferase [Chloroflexota bacterium]|nr:class I SAM-dependent methyltransferase [Chloroflexota bacterium]